MNERARRRALRSFVASILMSNLTRSEIYEIAEGFAFGDLGRELGEMLREASRLVRDVPSADYSYDAVEAVDPAKIAADIVLRKKFTRKTLLDLMATVAPRIKKSDIPSGSIRQLIEWFFAVATSSQSSRFLTLLSDDVQDPYLKGIIRRS